MKRPLAVPAAQVPDSTTTRLTIADTTPLVMLAPTAGSAPLPPAKASSW